MTLHAAFGDEYEIYQNDVEQGLNEPCFFIVVLKPEVSPMIGRRFIKRNPFDIHYFPKNQGDNREMFSIAEKLTEILDFIRIPGGDLLHGTGISYEVVDNVLHFFVSYNLPVMKTADEIYMETMETDVGAPKE